MRKEMKKGFGFIFWAFVIPLVCIGFMRYCSVFQTGLGNLFLYGIEGASPTIAAFLVAGRNEGVKAFFKKKVMDNLSFRCCILGMAIPLLILTMGKAVSYFAINQEHTCGFGKHVISTFNVSVQMDVLIDEVDVNDYDALAIPGGFREFGFKEEAFHPKTQALIRAFHEQEKSIATVCVAAFALAESGILKGKRATVYHLDNGKTQQELAEYGVNVINEPIVVDGNIITSYCPETAAGVAFQLLEMLIGAEKMKEVKYAMGYGC